MADARQAIVDWAKWGVAHRGSFAYTEGSNRMEAINTPPGTLPVSTDCSGAVTLWYKWAGAADPNGQGYDGEGYTGTLLGHGQEIPLSEVVPGDVVVYGPGTGWHTALIVEGGNNPLTVSHGEQGDPSYVYVNQDGRQPQRYLRFDTTAIANQSEPAGAAPVANNTVVTHQNILIFLGYLPQGSADGVLGPKTDAAIKAYQRTLHVSPDGVWGPATQAASDNLITALQKLHPHAVAMAMPVISIGVKGDAVAELQRHLGITADGNFGPMTQHAVMNFQQAHHLTVDGVVGAQTWSALGL